MNAAELALLPPAKDTAIAHSGVPWAHLLQPVGLAAVHPVHVPGLRLVVLRQLAAHLPPRRARHRVKMGALLAGLPLLLGGAGCLVSACPDPATREALPAASRSRAGSSPSPASSARRPASSSSRGIEDPVQAMFVLGIAGFFNDFVMPAAWASTMDIGGRYRARCRAR